MPAKYERIANSIRDRILTGDLKPGDRLPSMTDLREDFKVSYGSVRSAVLVLKAERLIEGRQGNGMFVTDPKTRAARG